MPTPGADTGRFEWVDRLFGEDPVEPKVGLGIAWFVLASGAAVVGALPTSLLFGLLAGVAGLQVAAGWRRAGRRPSRVVAGAGAVLLSLAALVGVQAVGAVALVFAAAALVAASVPFDRAQKRGGRVVSAGTTLRAGFVVGLAAAATVVVREADMSALLVLVVLVSAYDAGDFLMGAEAANPIEGPIAGVVAVAVLTFGLSVVQLPPFDSGSAWVFGGLVAVLAPLGRIVARLLSAPTRARAPALGRLDTYLLVAPAWAWAIWRFLG